MILHSFHYFISLFLITVKNYPWLHPLHSFSRHPAVVPTVSNRSDSCFHGKAASSGVAFVAPPDAVWQLATASLSLRPGCKNERASHVFRFVVRILKHHIFWNANRTVMPRNPITWGNGRTLGPFCDVTVYWRVHGWCNGGDPWPSFLYFHVLFGTKMVE